MAKGKRERPNLLRNVQSKSADLYRFHRHVENEPTTMQRNRSAHATLSLPEHI